MGNEQPIFAFTGPWGIRVELHPSIMLLAVLLVALGGDPVWGLMFAAGLIVSIFLHEMGHAWGCHVQGVPVQRVVIFGGGGFCQHAGATSRQQELIVIMGPLVNLALWALFSLAAKTIASRPLPGLDYQQAIYMGLAFLLMVSKVNLFLCFFNLMPVQPLDGGRLLYLFLLRGGTAQRARRIAGTIGFALSILWIPAMVALYVWQGWMLLFLPSIALHRQMMKS